VSERAAQKLARLQTIVAERAAWSEQLAQVKRMHQWVLDAEHLLDGSWAQAGEVVSNDTVGNRLDAWRQQMSAHLVGGSLGKVEQDCLLQFLQQLTNLRPYVVQCYDRDAFPRTNNDMERSIRGLKTRYRRISGRKNWNSYLLRYGRCVAYYEWWEQDATRRQHLIEQVARLDRARWRELRHEASTAQREQLTRFRFRHKREAFLTALEQRWAAAAPTLLLP
jgi:Transposase IS66 family